MNWLKQTGELPDAEIELFIFLHETIHFKKGDIVLEKGQIENYLYFISSGCMRNYKIKEQDGHIREYTFDLLFTGDYYSSFDSFVSRKPCDYFTDSVTDVTVHRISFDNLQKIYKQSSSSQIFCCLTMEKFCGRKIEREISLLTETVDERYKSLLKEHPQCLNEIPLKYIASYIGVTSQALSRIRRRVLKS